MKFLIIFFSITIFNFPLFALEKPKVFNGNYEGREKFKTIIDINGDGALDMVLIHSKEAGSDGYYFSIFFKTKRGVKNY